MGEQPPLAGQAAYSADDTPRQPNRSAEEDVLAAFADEGSALRTRRQEPLADAIQTFAVEMPGVVHDAPIPQLRPRVSRQAAIWAFAGLACALMAGIYLTWNRPVVTGPTALEGITGIDSRPEGVQVVIDGKLRGITPLRLNLPIGTHQLEIRHGTEVRSLPLLIEAGTSASQYIDFGPAVTPVSMGRLDVASDPPGASVSVDGVVSGNTPLTLALLPAGEHVILIGAGDSAVRRVVTVVPGATASIVAAIAQASMKAGWMSFKAPFDMEVFESGRLIGTTAMERIMLPAGSHALALVSAPVGFRTTAAVRIAPGATTTTVVAVPNGSLSVNAVPWANVEVDGRSIGVTPLANVPIPIGPHEVVWKHPQHGERRQTVSIKANTPTRVGMDLTQ